MVEIITFRDAIRGRVPRWLLGHWGYRLLYSLAIQFDAIGHTAVAGMKAGWPGASTMETLPILGRQRRVVRGPKWSDAKYAEKLRFWRQYHGTRGHAVPFLEEMRELLEPSPVRIALVYDNGYRYDIDASGVITHGPGTWNWDADSGSKWGRFWILLYDVGQPGPNYFQWENDGTWASGGTWGDDANATIGSTATLDEVSAVRQLVRLFSGPHGHGMNVIVVLDEVQFTLGPPDGDWDRWHNRNPYVVYWDGT